MSDPNLLAFRAGVARGEAVVLPVQDEFLQDACESSGFTWLRALPDWHGLVRDCDGREAVAGSLPDGREAVVYLS